MPPVTPYVKKWNSQGAAQSPTSRAPLCCRRVIACVNGLYRPVADTRECCCSSSHFSFHNSSSCKLTQTSERLVFLFVRRPGDFLPLVLLGYAAVSLCCWLCCILFGVVSNTNTSTKPRAYPQIGAYRVLYRMTAGGGALGDEEVREKVCEGNHQDK